jgi:hypothetical protein
MPARCTARGAVIFLPGRERAVDGAARLAGDELAVALLGLHLVLDDRDLAAGQDEARQAGDLDALEDVVVDGRLLVLAEIVFLRFGSQTTISASAPTSTAPFFG